MKFYPQWGSHLPLLIKIGQMTKGPILELGVGLFSTPVLHWLCFESKRELVSYEGSETYIRFFKNFRSDYHKIILAEDWDKIEIERPWDMVLVDHQDNRRRIEVERLANFAKYVIVHDTNPGADSYFRFSKVFPLYKYRHDDTSVRNHVTVLSNFVDLSNL